MGGERNRPYANEPLVTWHEDPPSGTDTYIYSPSFAPTKPWLMAWGTFFFDDSTGGSGDEGNLTSFRFGIQGSFDWDGDDATATWAPFVRPGELHESGNANPDFSKEGPISMFLDNAVTFLGGIPFNISGPISALPQIDPDGLDGGTENASFVPVILPRARVVCYINGSAAGGGTTEFTIYITQGGPN